MITQTHLGEGLEITGYPGMEINIATKDGVMTITLIGHLTFWDAKKFRTVISNMDNAEITNCVFDLHGLDSIDSSGLGMLVNASDVSSHHGYDVALIGAHGSVRGLLDISRMDTLFVIS
jgi:anti-sigma B factor antagonist